MTVQRTERELIDATRPFTVERRGWSWWSLISTLGLIALGITIGFVAPWWPVRLVVAIVTGLLIVRGFILYHDFMHGALLRGSKVARAIFYAYGVLVLTPPNVWRQTHNYHHAHTAKLVGSHVGSYAMVTTEMWKQLSWQHRLLYRITRHPLTILFGYFTIFIYGMCAASFLRNRRKNWDSALALVVHAALVAVVWHVAGAAALMWGYVLPLAVACATGGYLFYAQHNFPEVHIQPRESWSFGRASLESSSYMKLGPVLNYLTGNIGYHHVHHLNQTIPFYRLPEVMNAIPELQQAGVTSLGIRDIMACFRLKLWDAASQRMVGYPD